MENFLKRNVISSIISSIIFLILGIVIVCYPEIILTIIAYILGGIFLILGTIKIIGVLLNKESIKMYSNDIIVGIISIAFGIFVITCSNTIGSFFRIIIGLWIIYNSLTNIVYSFRLKNVDLSIWPVLFIMSIIMFVGGIYVAVNSGTIITTIGIVVIIYSVINLIESTIIYSNINKLM